MDLPSADGGHKKHAHPTPAVGGLIAGAVALLVFFGSLPWSEFGSIQEQQFRFLIAGSVTAMMVIGFIDDKFDISAPTRLFLTIFIAVLLFSNYPEFIISHILFPSINFVFFTGVWGFPFTVLCLVAALNAVNMADGRNGLVLGLALIWHSFFMGHALPAMLPTMAGVMGCLIVLFIFNLRGKLFLGDCGAYGIAMYYGFLALVLHRSAYGTVASAEAVLLFLIPVLDMGRLIVVRLAGSHSPLKPDSRHLHHLLDSAIGWTRGWFVYMALVGMPLLAYQLLPVRGVPLILGACLLYGVVIFLCTKRRPDAAGAT